MLRNMNVLLIPTFAAFFQLSNGQSLHAGRYFASAPVFASAPSLPPGPGPCGAPGGFLPVAAPPIVPPLPPLPAFPAFAPPPVPIPAPLPGPGPAIPAYSPGIVPAAPPPMAACAPGFPTAFPGGFGPFGSNKKNERHPIEQEEKPMDTPPMEPPAVSDPNAPKLEVKRKVPVEMTVNSTQTTVLQSENETMTVTEKPME